MILSRRLSRPMARIGWPLLLVALYLGLALFTSHYWRSTHRYWVTGDEPSYLVMARGIAVHRTLEQTEPLRDELRTREIYKPGFAPRDSEPRSVKTHAVLGPHGMYSVHNIGLPILLALPYAIAGTAGAKLFLIWLSSLIVVACWKISGQFSPSLGARAAAVAAICCGLPFVPAANQIYPDLVAGLICLLSLYGLLTAGRRSLLRQAAFALPIAYIPWLHIKLIAPALILTLAAILLAPKPRAATTAMAGGPLALSLALLGLYNHYAFGSPFGPYEQGALQPGAQAFMVLLGLHLDQNQGFLLHNPIFFVGVLFLIPFVARYRVVGFTVILVFLSLIVPNALHDNWYGGGSFSGRFAWAAATVFAVPTLYGLLEIAEKRRAVFLGIVGLAIALQIAFYWMYTFTSNGIALYQKPPPTLLDGYSLFYFPVQAWLPALYNIDWAPAYAPNYVFLAFSLGLLLAGALLALGRPPLRARIAIPVFVGFLATALLAGYAGCPACARRAYPAKDMLSKTGTVDGNDRMAKAGADANGLLAHGPVFALRRGTYEFRITYDTPAPPAENVGTWDIYRIDAAKPVASGQILSGEGAVVTVLRVEAWRAAPYEFRIVWDGRYDFRLHVLEIRRL